MANVDIAPTILSLAGAQPCNGAGVCRVLDGRSLLPAIQSDGANWPHDRAIPLELDTPNQGTPDLPCAYQGVQTPDQVLVVYHSVDFGNGCVRYDEIENYDLRSSVRAREPVSGSPRNCDGAATTVAQGRGRRTERLFWNRGTGSGAPNGPLLPVAARAIPIESTARTLSRASRPRQGRLSVCPHDLPLGTSAFA